MTANEFQQGCEAEPSGPHKARLEAEASMLAVARADIEGGRFIADCDVDAWLDAWVNGEPVELPEASTHSHRR